MRLPFWLTGTRALELSWPNMSKCYTVKHRDARSMAQSLSSGEGSDGGVHVMHFKLQHLTGVPCHDS